MNKNIKLISETCERKGNHVIKTTVESLPLYKVEKRRSEFFEQDLNDIFYGCHFCLKMWEALHDTKLEVPYSSSTTAMNEFKKLVKRNYGKENKNFRFYFVQLFRHSCEKFSLTPTNSRVDRWDSSIVGLCALPENASPENVMNMMTDIWEGTIDEYRVINNETHEVEESYEYWLNFSTYAEYKEMKQEILSKYGVDIEEAEEIYD